MNLLWTSYLRYLRKNLWLLVLSVTAVAVGVAVVLAIDVASISARKSFALSMQAMTGRSNYAVVGGGRRVPSELYRQLRVDWGLRRSAPVVEGYLSFPDPQNPGDPQKAVPLTLLGVDPLADGEIREWTGGKATSNGLEAQSLMAADGQVVATADTAKRLGWQVGGKRGVWVGSRRLDLTLAGTFQPTDERSSRALDNLLLTDISAAQGILNRFGVIDRIDLVLNPDEVEPLRAKLPSGFYLVPAGQSAQTATELSAAFHVNLQALSYLCLLVASFLIFNVVSFSVSHRRQSLGRLRVLGVTSRELGRLILGEALLLGAVGSLLGCLLGLLLGRALVPLVSRTLNDLYYVHAITGFAVSPWLILKAFGCGLLTCLVAAAVPAYLSAREEPLELLFRVVSPGLQLRAAWRAFGLGLVLLVASRVILFDPSLAAGHLSLLLIVLGSACILPLFLSGFALGLGALARSVAVKMGLRGISAFLGRTAVATIALTVATAATVSIAMMVSSFRGTLITWLNTTLTADVYISLKDRAGLMAGASLPDDKVREALQLPGVTDWIGQRAVTVPSSTGQTLLVGVRANSAYRGSLVFLESADQAWEKLESGAGAFLTEPYARRAHLKVGSKMWIDTPEGRRELQVLGVYYSYAPDRNLALVSHQLFVSEFHDRHWSGIGVFLQHPEQSSQMLEQLRRIFGEQVEVRATGNLKALALQIFERTFTVTEVLRFLALGIAFIGVFLSLLALSHERVAEVRVLRALGLGRAELFRLSLGQSLSLGLVSGLAAFPLGTVLSQVMITVINRRAFGWTITFQVDPKAALESVALALLASLLAGLYPAWLWSQEVEGEGLRERE